MFNAILPEDLMYWEDFDNGRIKNLKPCTPNNWSKVVKRHTPEVKWIYGVPVVVMPIKAFKKMYDYEQAEQAWQRETGCKRLVLNSVNYLILNKYVYLIPSAMAGDDFVDVLMFKEVLARG